MYNILGASLFLYVTMTLLLNYLKPNVAFLYCNLFLLIYQNKIYKGGDPKILGIVKKKVIISVVPLSSKYSPWKAIRLSQHISNSWKHFLQSSLVHWYQYICNPLISPSILVWLINLDNSNLDLLWNLAICLKQTFFNLKVLILFYSLELATTYSPSVTFLL